MLTSGFLQQAARERPAATDLPPLECGEVLVWRLDLVADAAVLDRLQCLLDDSERARAARFGPEAVRRRFVVARSMLRLLLGHYAGADPGALPLVTGLRGKPVLPLGYRLQFNLAHTGDLAMVAVDAECELGIDVEATPRDVDVQGVAALAFSAAEQHALRDTPERERHAAFARIWTRKEAYIKARGEGFWYPRAHSPFRSCPATTMRCSSTTRPPGRLHTGGWAKSPRRTASTRRWQWRGVDGRCSRSARSPRRRFSTDRFRSCCSALRPPLPRTSRT